MAQKAGWKFAARVYAVSATYSYKDLRFCEFEIITVQQCNQPIYDDLKSCGDERHLCVHMWNVCGREIVGLNASWRLRCDNKICLKVAKIGQQLVQGFFGTGSISWIDVIWRTIYKCANNDNNDRSFELELVYNNYCGGSPFLTVIWYGCT